MKNNDKQKQEKTRSAHALLEEIKKDILYFTDYKPHPLNVILDKIDEVEMIISGVFNNKSTDDIQSAILLKNLWNAHKAKELPKVTELNRERINKARRSIKEIPDAEDWKLLIKEINSNPFNLGRNKSNWRANFNWMLQEGKALELLELARSKQKPIKHDPLLKDFEGL